MLFSGPCVIAGHPYLVLLCFCVRFVMTSIDVKAQQIIVDALGKDHRNFRKTVLCHTPSELRAEAGIFLSTQDRLGELFTSGMESTIAVFPNMSVIRRLCKQSLYEKFSVELVFAVNSYSDPCMLALDLMNKFRTELGFVSKASYLTTYRLINTLYVWFPASCAPIVAGQLFKRSSKSDDLSNNIKHGQPARGLSQNPSRGHAWHQPTHEFAGPSGTTTEAGNNDVMYKIRRWSLPDAAVMPVLNVSSRVTWLELDDKALLDSYAVLQEGILCDVFSQKCSAAWQGAPGQRLTVSIMLPGPTNGR